MNRARSLAGMAFLAFLATGCPSTHSPTKNPSAPHSAPASLTGTEWVLQDLAGTPGLPNVKATLAFPEAGRAAGNASCNRFTGSAEISGDTLKFGMLASTRMACADEGVNSQETQYLKALAAAKRFELKDSTLPQAAAFYAGTSHALTLNPFQMPEQTVRSTIRFVAGRPNRFL